MKEVRWLVSVKKYDCEKSIVFALTPHNTFAFLPVFLFVTFSFPVERATPQSWFTAVQELEGGSGEQSTWKVCGSWVLKRGSREKYCAFLFDCLFKKKQNLCIFDKTVCFRTGTYIATQRLMETLEQSAIFGWEFDRKIFYRQGHTIILVFLFIVQGGPVYGTQWWKCALQDPRWCRKESNTFTYIPAFSTSWILLMNMCEICFFRPLFQKIHVFSISDIWCTMTRETETTSK